MAAVPTNLYKALQGIAVAAAAVGDASTVALCNGMAEVASFSFAPYSAAATSTALAPVPQDFYTTSGLGTSTDTSVTVGPAAGTAGSPW